MRISAILVASVWLGCNDEKPVSTSGSGGGGSLMIGEELKPFRPEAVKKLCDDPPRGSHEATVILIHGQGGSLADFASLRESLQTGDLGKVTRVVRLHFLFGSWFNFVSNDMNELNKLLAAGKEVVDMDSLDNATKYLQKVVDEEAKLLHGKYEGIYLVGHSQGGMLALWTGLTGGHRLGSIIAIAGSIPVINSVETISDKCMHTPVVFVHSPYDKHVPIHFAQSSINILQKAACSPFELKESHGGHEMDAQTDAIVTILLSEKIDGRTRYLSSN